eukprot:1194411-Prorocentrum_minimum.AAC.4
MEPLSFRVSGNRGAPMLEQGSRQRRAWVGRGQATYVPSSLFLKMNASTSASEFLAGQHADLSSGQINGETIPGIIGLDIRVVT